ncbi:MAG: histidine phosphatase family protein [Deltaproteobacteria bacterium]|jgi:broad specificity phosphatase PhoE|nr:histidine phosphatase family protein [Deltaproteobacteria bacterium]
MTTIYLVRHGITLANKENRFAGRTEEELLDEGKKQIMQVGDSLKSNNISAVYFGPAKRTVQSGEILGSLLNVPVSSLVGLDEINIPHWDGLTKDEIRRKYNDEYPTWLEAPQTFSLPGCEKLKQVQDRAVREVEYLFGKHEAENLLLVSHLIVLRCLVLFYQGLEISDFRSVKINNGSIIRLIGDDDGKRSIEPAVI